MYPTSRWDTPGWGFDGEKPLRLSIGGLRLDRITTVRKLSTQNPQYSIGETGDHVSRQETGSSIDVVPHDPAGCDDFREITHGGQAMANQQ